MFNLCKNKKAEAPVENEMRLWMENNFGWLLGEFGNEKFDVITQLTPSHFADLYGNTNTQSAVNCLKYAAGIMDISMDEIEIDWLDSGISEIDMGVGGIMYIQNEDETTPAGLYFPKNENGKYIIALDTSLLKEPQKLIATIVHELAHIKLLGEERIPENDELLTDLLTVFYGFGIFNANAAFEFGKDNTMWKYSKLGYLLQQEWAYALALFAYMKEEEDAAWVALLNKSVKADFVRSVKYIKENEAFIFNTKEK